MYLPMIKPQYVTDENAARVAVILPIAEYEELAERLEDLSDAAEIARRRHEVGIPLAEAMRLVREDGEIRD